MAAECAGVRPPAHSAGPLIPAARCANIRVSILCFCEAQMNALLPKLGRSFSVIGVVASLSVAVAGQGSSATSQGKPATPSAGKPATSSPAQTFSQRTPWGHPDLQGLWTNTTTTPLERPVAYGNKATLTPEERAEIDLKNKTNVDRPPPKGNPGAYNDFWFDRGAASNQTSLIIDPPNGRLPAKTPAGEAYQKNLDATRYEDSGRSPDSWENFDMYDRCVTRSMPGAMMPGFYNHNYEIVQTPQYVAISIEMIDDVRIIPLDGRPHVGTGVRKWLGDSRGHWEGDTLVVETTNFKEGSQEVSKMAQTIVGGSPDQVLIERFRRINANMMDYTITVNDPKVWTAPWTVSVPMIPLKGLIYEYACHEGNYALGNMLRGARADDRKRAAGTGSASNK